MPKSIHHHYKVRAKQNRIKKNIKKIKEILVILPLMKVKIYLKIKKEVMKKGKNHNHH
jgi:hypothetical protein